MDSVKYNFEDGSHIYVDSNNNGVSESEENLSIHELFLILLRGKWIIVFSFLLVFTFTVVFTLTCEPVYQAEEQILICRKRSPNSMSFLGMTGIGSLTNISNELAKLKSRSLTKEVAKKLLQIKYIGNTTEEITIIQPNEEETHRSFATIEDITGRIMNTMEFQHLKDSEVIIITAQSSKPEEAVLIANVYAESYYDRDLRSSRTALTGARKFLEDRLKDRKKKLVSTEDSLQNYMKKSRIVSVSEESSILIEKIAQLESKKEATELEFLSLRKTIESYQAQLIEQEPNAAKLIENANDPYIRLLQEKLAALEVQRDVTISQNASRIEQDLYKEKLEEIDSQILSLQEKLQKRTGDYFKSLIPGQSLNPASYLMELRQKIFETVIQTQVLQSKVVILDETLIKYQTEFKKIPQKSIELARLQRKKLSAEKLYLLIEEKYNEITIAEQSEYGFVEIFDPATVPYIISPKKGMNILLGILLGIGLGVGIVFVKEYLNFTIKMPEDLQKKGHIVIGVVPNTNLTANNSRKRARDPSKRDNRTNDPHLLVFINTRSPAAEAYRHVRTNLQYVLPEKGLRTLLVTSPLPAEGKTTVVCNLAVAFAQMGKRALLVDCDMRKPTIHHLFNFNKEMGLTDILALGKSYKDVVKSSAIFKLTERSLIELKEEGIPENICAELLGLKDKKPMVEEEFVSFLAKTTGKKQMIQYKSLIWKYSQNTVENLFIISCGNLIPNPAELLSSQAMYNFVEQAREEYDIVLIDSPPILSATDSSILSSIVDGTIIVAKMGSTPIDAIQSATDCIKNVEGKPLGIILNMFDNRQAYGGYHGYYHHKFYTYYNNDYYYGN